MDNLLNVLNAAPKISKKRKPKPEGTKKSLDLSINSSSPPHSTSKPESQSPVHSPSTLDLDSLTAPRADTSLDESLPFSEPSETSVYVPISSENCTVATEDATPDPEPAAIKVEPIVEKPPQLKVRFVFKYFNDSDSIMRCIVEFAIISRYRYSRL